MPKFRAGRIGDLVFELPRKLRVFSDLPFQKSSPPKFNSLSTRLAHPHFKPWTEAHGFSKDSLSRRPLHQEGACIESNKKVSAAAAYVCRRRRVYHLRRIACQGG